MPVLSLPPRGARVDTNRGAELRADLNPQEVVQRINNLIDREQVRLTDMPALRSLPSSIVSENAVGVLAYNLVRSLMNDAAAVLEIHPREVSFSRSRQCLDLLQRRT